MPGLVPGIHVFASIKTRKTWMAGTGPAMTKDRLLSTRGDLLMLSLKREMQSLYPVR
jgi:hypothetical protein